MPNGDQSSVLVCRTYCIRRAYSPSGWDDVTVPPLWVVLYILVRMVGQRRHLFCVFKFVLRGRTALRRGFTRKTRISVRVLRTICCFFLVRREFISDLLVQCDAVYCDAFTPKNCSRCSTGVLIHCGWLGWLNTGDGSGFQFRCARTVLFASLFAYHALHWFLLKLADELLFYCTSNSSRFTFGFLTRCG